LASETRRSARSGTCRALKRCRCDKFVGLVAAQAGQRAKVQVAPSWIIRCLALFNPTLRAVAEQLY
jgi:hypothetical protein